MGIIGHKERALQRRGYQIQESLRRRDIVNESFGGIISDQGNKILASIGRLNSLCDDDGGIYCELINSLKGLRENEAKKIYSYIEDIYQFYKNRITNDNKTLFKKTLEVLLKNENPVISFKLVVDYMYDTSFDEKVKVASLKSFIKSNGSIEEDALEDFLKLVRKMQYSKYEESFEGDHFDLIRGYIQFQHGYEDEVSSFPKLIANILNLKYGDIEEAINLVSNKIVTTILNTETMEMIDKADLKVKSDLMLGSEVILRKGSKVEVKKMDYNKDSYFSEFFAIYKNPKGFPEYNNNPRFKEIYNEVINKSYLRLKTEGHGLLTKIKTTFDAIIYENNLIIKTEDIDLYWSNKGQRNCDDKRLSIRYRLNKSKIKAYVYTNGSNELKSKEISVKLGGEVIC